MLDTVMVTPPPLLVTVTLLARGLLTPRLRLMLMPGTALTAMEDMPTTDMVMPPLPTLLLPLPLSLLLLLPPLLPLLPTATPLSPLPLQPTATPLPLPPTATPLPLLPTAHTDTLPMPPELTAMAH